MGKSPYSKNVKKCSMVQKGYGHLQTEKHVIDGGSFSFIVDVLEVVKASCQYEDVPDVQLDSWYICIVSSCCFV